MAEDLYRQTLEIVAHRPGYRDVTRWLGMYTIPFNVTGNPALSVPTRLSSSGLPLGLQIVGRAFDEATVLQIGAAYEAANGFGMLRPPLATAA